MATGTKLICGIPMLAPAPLFTILPSGPTVNFIERDSLVLRSTLTSYSPGFALVIVNNGGQVNVANQQVNVSKTE